MHNLTRAPAYGAGRPKHGVSSYMVLLSSVAE